MSYKLAVLRDHPIAFFPLNASSVLRTYATILQEYNTYQDWLDNEPNYGYDPVSFTMEDISDNGNHSAAFTLGSANFLDILPLSTLANYDPELSGCRVTSNGEISISNTPMLYKMFYSGTENLVFTIEMWINFEQPPAQDTNLFRVHYLNNDIFNLVANNNTITLTAHGKNSITSAPVSYSVQKEIDDWSSKVHIVATFNKNTINVAVNGVFAAGQIIPSNFVWSYSKSNNPDIYYVIGPSYSGGSFIINDLAFYDYALPQAYINNHINWGASNTQPQNIAKMSNSSFFDILESPSMFSYKKTFNLTSDYAQGVASNLSTNANKNGLTLSVIPNLTAIGSINYSNGLSVSSGSAAKFVNLSDYINLNRMSIFGQINWSSVSGSNPYTILSFDNIGAGNWLYLAQTPDNKLGLYYYSQSTTYPYSYSRQLLASTPTSVTTSGTKNFAISTNGNYAEVYLQGSGTGTTNSLPQYQQLTFNAYFGNQFSTDTTNQLNGSISNISIVNNYSSTSSYQLYGTQAVGQNVFFNPNLSVSQVGTWKFVIPASQLAGTIGGRINWNSGSSDNTSLSANKSVRFDISTDYGNTYSQIHRNSSILQLTDASSYTYNDLNLRVTVYSTDSSQTYQPDFSNVDIALYNNLTINSDSGAFILQPRQRTYQPNSFTIKGNTDSILTRPSNFGIKLSNLNSAGSIAELVSTTTFPSSVEFWFRPESYVGSGNQTVFYEEADGYKIYLDPSTNTLYNSGFASVYVNGQSIGAGRVLTFNEIYHIVCVMSSNKLTNFYLGGDGTSGNNFYGTFGYINVYQYFVTQQQALNRYLQYLTINTSQVDVGASMNSIGTISEYSASNTSFNQGIPYLFYDSALKP